MRHGMDARVPAGLLEGHPQVVGVVQVERRCRGASRAPSPGPRRTRAPCAGSPRAHPRSAPARAASRLSHQGLELSTFIASPTFTATGSAVLGAAASAGRAASIASVLDVVVDQEGVVEQLDRHGGVDRRARDCPRRRRRWRGTARGRSPLPERRGYERDQVVEVAARLAFAAGRRAALAWSRRLYSARHCSTSASVPARTGSGTIWSDAIGGETPPATRSFDLDRQQRANRVQPGRADQSLVEPGGRPLRAPCTRTTTRSDDRPRCSTSPA